MVQEATVTATVAASGPTCWDVAADIEEYPSWAADIKEAEVLARDDEGRPLEVRFRAAAMGRSTSYVLRYDYSGAPSVLRWEQVEGDVTTHLSGHYRFSSVPGDTAKTEVEYHLEVDLQVPLPGFVKRRAEGRIIHTALADFQARVES